MLPLLICTRQCEFCNHRKERSTHQKWTFELESILPVKDTQKALMPT
uniref:Uncharacterized protein n=1 Tax=Anguilla anguilla TaxID=7936 RepID=A0A0E9PV12_ANGAN